MTSRLNSRRPGLTKDARGQVFVEYLVLVVVTGAALVLLVGPVVGPQLIRRQSQDDTG